MRYVGVLIATVAVGFVAFQNCQQAPHPSDLAASDAAVTQTSTNKVDLQGEKISDINFIFAENETVTRSSGSYQVLVNKNLKVELPSGKMTLTSDLDSSSSSYCLTETLINELTTILKTSQVCKQGAANDGRLCTQVMKLPYAILDTEKENYSLGSASDGCGSNSVDLCGDQATVLAGFYASLKTNYKSFTCTP